MSGSISHVLFQTEVAEVDDTIDLDQLRVPGENTYTLKFPETPPTVQGTSLVVSSIDSHVVSTIWSAPTTESAGLAATNGNDLLLVAPDPMTQSYALRFPDASAGSLVGSVLSIASDISNELTLEFKSFDTLLDVRMTDNTTEKYIRLNAPSNLVHTHSISLGHDFTAGVDALQGKVIYVQSDDLAGSVTLGWADPYELFNLSFNKLQVQMNNTQDVDAHVLFPSYIGDGTQLHDGKLLGIVSQRDTTLELGYLSEPRISSALFGDMELTYSGNAMVIVVPEPIQRTTAVHNLTQIQALYESSVVRVRQIDDRGRIVLELAQPGILAGQNDIQLKAAGATGAASAVVTLPAYDVSRTHVGDYIVVSADDGVGNIQLSFEACPKLIDDANLGTNPPPFCRLATLDNISSYNLYLPEATGALAPSSLLGRAARVHAQAPNDVYLCYEDGGFIYNKIRSKYVKLASPLASTDEYTLKLPLFDPAVGAADGYAGRIVSVVASTSNSIELDFTPLSSFAQIKQIGLSSNNGQLVTTLKPGAGAAANTILRIPSKQPGFGDVLTIQSASIGASATIVELGWDKPMTLRSNTGLFASLRADPFQSQGYDLFLPSTYAGKQGKIALLDATGVLEFGNPSRVELTEVDGGVLADHYTTLQLPSGLQHSYTLQLPAIGANELGKLLIVDNTASATTLPLAFQEAGYVKTQTSHVLINAPTGLTQSYSLELPVSGAASIDKLLTSTFDNGTHTLMYDDLLVQPIASQVGTHACTLVSRALENELHADILIEEPSDGVHVVKRTLVPPSPTASIPARLAQLTPIPGCTYTATGSGVGDELRGPTGGAALAVDGVSVGVGDVVLIAAQLDQRQNGLYIVTDAGTAATNFVLTRHTSFDAHNKIKPSVLVDIQNGTHAGKRFICTCNPFPRVGRGLVRNINNIIQSAAECQFITDSEPVVGQCMLVSGIELTVTSVESETEVKVTPTPTSLIVESSYMLGFRTGTDPITFREIEPSQSARPRLDVGFADESFDRLEIGSGLTLLARHDSETSQDIKLPDFNDVGKALTASVSGSTVTISVEAPADMLSVAGTTAVLSLPGSGVDVNQQELSDLTGNTHIISFDGLTPSTSSPASFVLDGALYGLLANSADCVFTCARTGLYAFTLILEFEVATRSASVDHARGSIEIALKRTDGAFLNASLASEQSQAIEDTRVLIGPVGSKSSIRHTFIIDAAAADALRFEITHTHADQANINGTFKLNTAALLIESID